MSKSTSTPFECASLLPCGRRNHLTMAAVYTTVQMLKGLQKRATLRHFPAVESAI